MDTVERVVSEEKLIENMKMLKKYIDLPPMKPKDDIRGRIAKRNKIQKHRRK